jgi:hypothetical protein
MLTSPVEKVMSLNRQISYIDFHFLILFHFNLFEEDPKDLGTCKLRLYYNSICKLYSLALRLHLTVEFLI